MTPIARGQIASWIEERGLAQIDVLAAEEQGEEVTAEVGNRQTEAIDHHAGEDPLGRGHQRQRDDAGGAEHGVEADRQAHPGDETDHEPPSDPPQQAVMKGLTLGRVTP